MNSSLGALPAEVPLAVVTVTSTVPVPAGETTVRLVAVVHADRGARGGAEVDGRGAGQAVPLTVTEVPPAVGPLPGLTEVTVGTPGRCR